MKKLLDWAPVRFGLEVARLYFGRHVSRSAAALAYFLLLSFFPLLICVNAFIGLLRLDVGAVLDAAAAILPRETLGILADYMGYITTNQSPALLLAGAGMTLFSASAAFRTLMRVMEELYGRGGYRGVKRIAASVAFSVLFLLTVYLAVAVLFTAWHSRDLSTPAWRGALAVLTVLICASTVFIKQHSILDTLAGLALCLPIYWVIYGFHPKGRAKA